MPRPANRADVVAAVRALAAKGPDRTVFVGIDGFGAAGKSTLAATIARAVTRVVVVHVDDFARPSVAEWEWDRFQEQLLNPLRDGRRATYQVWDWTSDTGGDWVTVDPGQIVVVEGVSSTRAEVDVAWDLTVWVSAPRDVRLERAVERDGAAMLDTWLQVWMPPERAYAERERPYERVDLVVDGTDPDVGAKSGRMSGP